MTNAFNNRSGWRRAAALDPPDLAWRRRRTPSQRDLRQTVALPRRQQLTRAHAPGARSNLI
jgi:hypothetical protein